MSSMRHDFTKVGFAKTFVLPALLVFLIPFLSYLFFSHAQARFDAQAREAILAQIRSDTQISEQDRVTAIAYFTATPFSQLITNEKFAANATATSRFNYATFRWMIRLSLLSLGSGVTVFVLAGICAWVSLRSQFAQYLGLLIGWHALRIYSALQTIVMGILLVALSFWVTALWFNFYSLKLILIAGALSVVGVCVVLAAIFRTPKSEFPIEGAVLTKDTASPLWQELNTICAKVGTTVPDQVIAGIDDNFFVTEHPVTVEGKEYRGKTLFVSLPLLKQLNSTEADAVLAHEMAHFSGQDTLYSTKISPLLVRYQNYLQSLHGGVISLPVFYFMLCFRAVFEISLGTLSRQREFRADGIAASVTSPQSCAAALLRTAAYSKFRQSVEQDLFQQERAMETADVSARIEQGFPAYATAFASNSDIGHMETSHPFDSHPPLSQRLSALGVHVVTEEAQACLTTPGNGGWHRIIDNADAIERQQWEAYEARFRKYHEESLPYRFLPATDDEREIVERSFPAMTFEVKDGILRIDFEKVHLATWADAIAYGEITHCALNDKQVLEIQYQRSGKRSRSIAIAKFSKDSHQTILNAFQQYYGRYLAAVEYQKTARLQAEQAATDSDPHEDVEDTATP